MSSFIVDTILYLRSKMNVDHTKCRVGTDRSTRHGTFDASAVVRWCRWTQLIANRRHIINKNFFTSMTKKFILYTRQKILANREPFLLFRNCCVFNLLWWRFFQSLNGRHRRSSCGHCHLLNFLSISVEVSLFVLQQIDSLMTEVHNIMVIQDSSYL